MSKVNPQARILNVLVPESNDESSAGLCRTEHIQQEEIVEPFDSAVGAEMHLKVVFTSALFGLL